MSKVTDSFAQLTLHETDLETKIREEEERMKRDEEERQKECDKKFEEHIRELRRVDRHPSNTGVRRS